MPISDRWRRFEKRPRARLNHRAVSGAQGREEGEGGKDHGALLPTREREPSPPPPSIFVTLGSREAA